MDWCERVVCAYLQRSEQKALSQRFLIQDGAQDRGKVEHWDYLEKMNCGN